MACGVALKRPHEYDSYLQLNDAPPEAKRARGPMACSPFRPQMGTLAASLPSSSNSLPQSLEEGGSTFAAAAARCNMTQAQVDAFLRAEMRSLRRRKLIPRRCVIDGDDSVNAAGGASPPRVNANGGYRVPGSPQSGSDSEGETCNNTAKRRVMATLPAAIGGNTTSDLYKKPMYSLNQVVLMCERLLKEQEMRIRFEYQQVMDKKLQEQQEQLSSLAAEAQRRVTSPKEDYSCSYLS